MTALRFWLKFGRRCKARRPSSLHEDEWSRCTYTAKQHPSWQGSLEHYDGTRWWM